MSIEDLKHFDGSLEGAAAVAGVAEESPIDWTAVSENLGVLQEHLRHDIDHLTRLKEVSGMLEEARHKYIEGDPVREQVETVWRNPKQLISEYERDHAEVRKEIESLLAIDFSTTIKPASSTVIH